ncbi:mitochondrial 54S ribosomal protein YmL2 [Martiniozyma asiatica (nom. inval.)]|nr:mitochondrial 54S ribosomal protein YmL2 [Martiniozyma asiatica]
MFSFSLKASTSGNKVFQLVALRNAHKKVVSSKTHMQDSPGKRLGPKKHDGAMVKTGQIIYRQRGTKWYPGHNVGIGKDHTLYAKEPGIVRYYLDPFHPKRQFVGVVGKQDVKEKDIRELKLPLDHFEPNGRRLGKRVLTGKWAEKENEFVPRKTQLALENVMGTLVSREEKRSAKSEKFSKEIDQFVKLSPSEKLLALERLVKIDGFLRGGKSLSDSRFHATWVWGYDLGLAVKRSETTQEDANKLKLEYAEMAQKIDDAIMFDAKFNLTKNLTANEITAMKEFNIGKLEILIPDVSKPVSKKVKEEAMNLINAPCFTLKEQIRIKRKFLKPVLPISELTLSDEKDKKATVIYKMNEQTKKVETVYLKKNAFLPK